MRIVRLLASCLALHAASPGMTRAEPPEPPSAAVAALVRDTNAFAADLYARVRAQTGNLVCSPSSIATALAMTWVGARGDTAAEMARTLRLSLTREALPAAWAGLLAAQRAPSSGDAGWRLSTANRLWGQRGVEFLAPFLAAVRAGFGAELGRVDFAGAPDAARGEINAWVADETARKIPDLLAPGAITSDTRLVLTNAIYFRADWARQFDRRATADQPFHIAPGTSAPVSLMFATVRAGYAAPAEARVQVLELPYRGDELSMVILLPDTPDGLADLEGRLTADRLAEWTAAVARREVIVHLPRFAIEWRTGLAPTLAAMGMPLAFSERADFSGMNGQRDLSISAVVHAARIEVDEQGTEAAAATGVAVGIRSAVPQEPPTVRADHPFVFLVRDRRTGAILFLGRLVDPRAAGGS